jgi:hypothetical protein
MSPVTAALKFVGSAIRLITTLIEIGKDKALLTSYGLGAALNGVLVAQVLCSSQTVCHHYVCMCTYPYWCYRQGIL